VIRVKTLIVGPIQACCYVVSPDGDNSAMIIDPGGDGDLIIEHVRSRKLAPLYIVNTHGHGDHMGANAEVKAAFPNAKVCIHPLDAPMLGDANKNLSAFFGANYRSPVADWLIDEGDVIKLGSCTFDVLHVPGHSPGSVCLVHDPKKPKEKITIFTGDTLFAAGIGRTDFPGGSMTQLVRGIKEKILSLPDSTVLTGESAWSDTFQG
jgi:hydroxyacylglutathione hydrolase